MSTEKMTLQNFITLCDKVETTIENQGRISRSELLHSFYRQISAPLLKAIIGILITLNHIDCVIVDHRTHYQHTGLTKGVV
jgi:hypothetical protein